MTYIYTFLGFFIFICLAISIEEYIHRSNINKRIKKSEDFKRYGKSSNTKWWDR